MLIGWQKASYCRPFCSLLCCCCSALIMSSSLQPPELQHTRFLCPPLVCSNSCPWSQQCHQTISSSVIPFSSCPQSFPASRSLPMSQLFAWGGQIIGVSASTAVLPMNTQDWSPLGWTGWISSSPRDSEVQEIALKMFFICWLVVIIFQSAKTVTMIRQ